MTETTQNIYNVGITILKQHNQRVNSCVICLSKHVSIKPTSVIVTVNIDREDLHQRKHQINSLLCMTHLVGQALIHFSLP